MGVWLLGPSPAPCTSQPVRLPDLLPREYPLLLFSNVLAGVKPALAAATFISGLAGIWSYVKRAV